MSKACVLHGLPWLSEVPLPWAQETDAKANAWRVNSPCIETSILNGAQGKRVAGYQRADESFEVRLQEDGKYVLSFSDLVHFIIDPEAMSVRPLCQSQADTALVAVLLANSVSAFLLSLDGRTALHASAVIIENRAFLFCGPSNQGKSTLAAALCAEGASLHADDTLAWREGEPGAVAHRGVTELRLRESARALARCLGTPSQSPDGRFVVRPVASERDPVPIALVIHPNNQSDAASPRIDALGGASAHARLLASTRLGSWTTPLQQVNALRDAHRLARLCPNVELTLSLQATAHAQARKALFQLILAAGEASGA